VNLEDPLEELQRRIQAIALRYDLTASDFGGRLFLDSGRQQRIVVARDDRRNGIVINQPLVASVVDTITANRVDCWIIDPFISAHAVPENDNGAIDMVAKELAGIADVTNCAVEVVHHVRKSNGAELTVDDARGAVALIGAARSVRVINSMTADEAAKAGIDPAQRRLYFRIDNGKANLAPPIVRSELAPAGERRPGQPARSLSGRLGRCRRWLEVARCLRRTHRRPPQAGAKQDRRRQLAGGCTSRRLGWESRGGGLESRPRSGGRQGQGQGHAQDLAEERLTGRGRAPGRSDPKEPALHRGRGMGRTMTCSTLNPKVSQGVAQVSRFTPLRHCATCATPSFRRGGEVERRRGAPPRGRMVEQSNWASSSRGPEPLRSANTMPMHTSTAARAAMACPAAPTSAPQLSYPDLAGDPRRASDHQHQLAPSIVDEPVDQVPNARSTSHAAASRVEGDVEFVERFKVRRRAGGHVRLPMEAASMARDDARAVVAARPTAPAGRTITVQSSVQLKLD
jgi:hypothetical protein